MHRRDFLRIAALGDLAVATAPARTRIFEATAAGGTGPYGPLGVPDANAIALSLRASSPPPARSYPGTPYT